MDRIVSMERLAMLAVSFLSIFSIQIFSLQKTHLHSSVSIFSKETRLRNNELTLLTKAPSLGCRNLFADYAFVQFLSYFGDDEARSKEGYRESVTFFETVLQHDPYFKDFYFYLSQSTSVYAGMPDKTVDLMNKSIKALTPSNPADGYHIWRYKGIDELLFVGNSKSAQHSFETAARWAAQSAEPDSVAVSRASYQTAQFLSNNPDSKEAQISAWTSVIVSTIDKETRENAVKKIYELGGKVTFGENGGVIVEYGQEPAR